MAQFFVLMALLVAVVSWESASGNVYRNNCTKFNTASNCSCTDSSSPGYPVSSFHLKCSAGANLTMTPSSEPSSYNFHVRCTRTTNMRRLMDDLSGLHIGYAEYLILDGCPLSNVSIKELMSKSGISKVKELTVDSNINATFQKRNFENLDGITGLTLNNNNMTELPVDLFEGLSGLTRLEMKNNVITFPEGIYSTTPKLVKVYIHHNSFTHLNLGVFNELNYLTNLTLEHNQLENLTNGAYSDLPISHLPKCAFNNTPALKYLHFTDSLISDLPKGLFNNTPALQYLNLSRNRISQLPIGLFNNTPALQYLDLAVNCISHLPIGLFSNTPALVYLDLTKNCISDLPKGLFNNTPALQYLNLSRNRISQLPIGLFNNTPALQYLDLAVNCISHLPIGLFNNTPALQYLDLAVNCISHLPIGLFSNTPALVYLDLTKNCISDLPEGLFNNTPALQRLYLNKNRISQLPIGLFNNTPALKHLYLSENVITHLPIDLFKKTFDLEFLELSNNRIQIIPHGLFQDLYSLSELYLGSNQIQEIDGDIIIHSYVLTTLDISNNMLSKLPEDLTLYNYNLKELRLKNNSLTEVYKGWLRIKIVDLSFNHIHSLQITTEDFLHYYEADINLKNNNINRIDVNQNFGDDVGCFGILKPLKTLHLDNNPLTCDCSLLAFLQLSRGQFPHPKYSGFDIHYTSELKCNAPQQLSNTPIDNVTYSDLTCDLSNLKNYSCPLNCSCEYRAIDQGHIITCEDTGLTQLPEQLPVYSTANHTELNIKGNHLQNLQISFNGYENVTHWRLSCNNITDISFSGEFSAKLELLNLSYNKFSELSADTIQFITSADNVKTISLHGNRWNCDCHTKLMKSLLTNKYKQITDINNVTCSDGRRIKELKDSELCPTLPTPDFFSFMGWICAVFGLLIATLTVVYFNYQQQIRIYCFSSDWKVLRWMVARPDADKDKIYDAFISYAHPDESFVLDHLVPHLEVNGETKFKLCLHFRDWIPGESIYLQILRSIKESRRIIVVLSPNYLTSDWGRMEFNAAYDEALMDGKMRVIVILYQDIGPIDELEERIKIHLKMNTYLKWESRWFWQQLSFAMPHPPSNDDDIRCVFCPSNHNKSNDYLAVSQGEMLSMNTVSS